MGFGGSRETGWSRRVGGFICGDVDGILLMWSCLTFCSLLFTMFSMLAMTGVPLFLSRVHSCLGQADEEKHEKHKDRFPLAVTTTANVQQMPGERWLYMRRS